MEDECSSEDSPPTLSRKQNPSRILFASCNSQNLTQPLWPVMASRHPAALVWVGDAIYADAFAGFDFWKLLPKHNAATPTQLRQYYQEQSLHPGYAAFLKGNRTTVFGAIDDHDYGMNNGDRTYKYKRESAMAYMDFIGEPSDSLMRRRSEQGKGIYGVKLFDFARESGRQLISEKEAGIDPDVTLEIAPNYSNHSVAVFILDVRSNRSPWPKGLAAWRQSDEGEMLGEEQWSWLERALKNSKATVNVIVSGLQVHPHHYPNANMAEEWYKYPRERQRLYELLLQEGLNSPIIISGDVHMAQLMRKDCFRRDDPSEARSLVEFTTSGLTHSWGTIFASSEHIHKSWYAWYVSFFGKTFMGFLHLDGICPWTELIEAKGNCNNSNLHENGGAERSKSGKQYSLELNFGELDFDWEKRVVQARAFGMRGTDRPLLSASWSFDQLSGQEDMPRGGVTMDHILNASPQITDKWVCINHNGPTNSAHYTLILFLSSILLIFLVLLPYLLIGCGTIFAARIFGTPKKKNARVTQ
mmetsp:Transcript_22030/g.32545  ORF Transcript_22030/g.32545 Transcript_22030/m.32545 type:complete len:528 (+) Transcript_22030:106-1689(+)